MGYKSKVQRIDRRGKDNRQYYIMCPAALAEALEIEKGEAIEWIIESKDRIIMKRELKLKQRRNKKK